MYIFFENVCVCVHILQEIFQGVAGGLLSCVAAAKSPLAGSALVGNDVGALVLAPQPYYNRCIISIRICIITTTSAPWCWRPNPTNILLL